MGRVDGKVALITGGARGLGEATGRLLAKEGAFVVLTDVLDADGKTLADDIVANGGKASYLHQDVTDEASWSDTMGAIVAEHGRLDIVVNNAGIVLDASVEDTTLEGWRRVNSINSEAVFLGTREAIKVMKIRIPRVARSSTSPRLQVWSALTTWRRITRPRERFACSRSRLPSMRLSRATTFGSIRFIRATHGRRWFSTSGTTLATVTSSTTPLPRSILLVGPGPRKMSHGVFSTLHPTNRHGLPVPSS